MICASCGAELDSVVATATSVVSDCPKCDGAIVLAERYRLIAVLGRGASGITYRAERTTDGAVFAIKEIPLRTLENAKAMELFEREARVLRELDHRAVPRYEGDFVFGEGKNAALYLVQELVSGRTLAEEMGGKRYDVGEVFAIVAELAEVLDYLHRRSPPVIHRDVKPKNVMRRDASEVGAAAGAAGGVGTGRLVLIDFGSVRDVLSKGGGSTMAGTFGYMAPEQLAGRATPASDVYALGALAVALLTRKEPDTLLGDDHRIDVREHVEASEEALTLLEEMLDPSAAKRPQRATDVQKRAQRLCSATTSTQPTKPKNALEPPKPSAKKSGSTSRTTATKETERGKPQEVSVYERRAREREEKRHRKEEGRRKKEERRQKAAREAQARDATFVKDFVERSETDRAADVAPHKSGKPERVVARKKRNAYLKLAAAIVIPSVFTAGLILYKHDATTGIATTTIGEPELYARPIAVDVNGDGTEDVIVVTGIDRGEESYDDGEDTWGKENGHFDAFVQAIDGKSGKVLYAIKIGQAYTSLGNEAKTSERIALVTRGNRLGIARIPIANRVSMTIHDLATGKEIQALSFSSSSGQICETIDAASPQGSGSLLFAGTSNTGGTEVDLEHGTSKAKVSGCPAGGATANANANASANANANASASASPNIADVAISNITDRTIWALRFSNDVVLTSGAWTGRNVVTPAKVVNGSAAATFGKAAVENNDRGYLVVDNNVEEKAEALPTITIDNGGFGASSSSSASSSRDNGKIQVIGVDLPAGTKRFARTLASVGITRDVIDHIEAVDRGALLFFTGTGGLALLDAVSGAKKWSLALPRGHRITSYTLSKTRAYLHVFGPGDTVFGFLSKKLGSRILVVDLEKGRYLQSFPKGSLEPERSESESSSPSSPTTYAYDPKAFPPVRGCMCTVPMTSSAARPTSDGGARVTNGNADAGGGRGGHRIQLGMYTRSTVESGGHKRFGVAYALDVDGAGFALPHYNELRESIAPPRTLEGEISLGVACDDDTIVFVNERIATAWSLSKRDELWTSELPIARSEPKTVLGGGASLACVFGRIEKGNVYIPKSTSGEVILSLADGSVVGGTVTQSRDAGAAKPKR